MKKVCAGVFFIFLINLFIYADEFAGVQYKAPSGWKQERSAEAVGFAPQNIAPQNAVALVLSGAQDLGTKSFSDWIDQQMQAELAGGKMVQQSEPNKQKDGDLDRVTVVRVVEDAQGNLLIQMYHAISNGRKAALAAAVAVSEEAANTQASIIQAFFASLRFAGVQPQSGSSTNFSLIGDWTTTSFFGDIVDSNTGSFQSTSYSGEWYSFRSDGTYHYTIIASGLIISGAVVEKGTFQVVENRLVLNRKTASWFPFPGKEKRRPGYKDRASPEELRYGIEMRNANEISIQESEGMWTRFQRKPQ